MWHERLKLATGELGRGFLQLIYPGACLVCDRLLSADEIHFCPECRGALIIDPRPTCRRCASTIGPFLDTSTACPRCRDDSFQFERALRLGPYDGTLRSVVLRMKYLTGETLAEAVGLSWAQQLRGQLSDIQADMVIPVPLHWWRRWQRGYNQVETLARQLATGLKLPCHSRWLRRIRSTPSQTSGSPTARRVNLRGAFRARSHPALKGKCVLLIDDVLTTGSTASEAARALRTAGAARVVVAVLARSI